jgi:phytanoyl-CoA hydroxylase
MGEREGALNPKEKNEKTHQNMLNDKQVNQYKHVGYTVYPGILGASEVLEILQEVELICAHATRANHDASRMEMEPNQGPEGTMVRRLYEPCTYYPRFRALSESKGLLDCVEQLLGPNLNFHYSKLNMKPPSIGSVVEWHQDLVYYPLTNRDSLAVLFYLDDADSGNGCLRVIPKRHLGPALDHTLNGIFQGRVTEAVDEAAAIALEGGSGTAIFMHAMTPHASAPNTSPKPRRTLILSYRAADAFPIYLGKSTDDFESHVRLIRGECLRNARFMSGAFPIPKFPQKTKSLYELQDLSHSNVVSSA